jgi:hypothetical protein
VRLPPADPDPDPHPDVRLPHPDADPDTTDPDADPHVHLSHADADADMHLHADADADADQSGSVEPGTHHPGTDTEHVFAGRPRADADGYPAHAAHLGQRDRLGGRPGRGR